MATASTSLAGSDVPIRERIGLVGLGLMGSALAERLIGGGYEVLGFDIAPERMAASRRLGVVVASTPAEIAGQCRRIILSLFDSAGVKVVLQQMRDNLHAGQIIMDTTTGDPADAIEAGGWLAALGVDYLDATISGNSDQVRQAEVTAMVGGQAPENRTGHRLPWSPVHCPRTPLPPIPFLRHLLATGTTPVS